MCLPNVPIVPRFRSALFCRLILYQIKSDLIVFGPGGGYFQAQEAHSPRRVRSMQALRLDPTLRKASCTNQTLIRYHNLSPRHQLLSDMIFEACSLTSITTGACDDSSSGLAAVAGSDFVLVETDGNPSGTLLLSFVTRAG